MSTALFKRILLNMKHEAEAREALVNFDHAQYADVPMQLALIETFNRDYQPEQAIWWYTRECFTYQVLNRALRLLESDRIVDMDFLIRDLHRQLQKVHHQQFADYRDPSWTVYRGQKLPTDQFAKLQQNRGGLIAFNNFLSASKDRAFPEISAEGGATEAGMVRDSIEEEFECGSGWECFAKMLYKLGESEKAEELYVFLLERALNSDDAADCYNSLGMIRAGQGNYDQALKFYEKGLSMEENKPILHYCELISLYQNIGILYIEMEKYSEALSYFEKALDIRRKMFPLDHPHLALCYNNISAVFHSLHNYSQALCYRKQATEIREKRLPANHSLLAASSMGR